MRLTLRGVVEGAVALLKGGGEGSRGGHVIGHTKSGKAIYRGKFGDTKRKDWNTRTKGFTLEDHQDAQRLHWEGARDDRDGQGLAHNTEALLHGEKIRALGGKGIGASDVYGDAGGQAQRRSKDILGHTKSGRPVYDVPPEHDVGGSAGYGPVLSHTSSGKAIYPSDTGTEHDAAHAGFTARDHEEAAEVHAAAARLGSKLGDAYHARQERAHRGSAAAKVWGENFETKDAKLRRGATGRYDNGSVSGHILGHTTSGKPVHFDSDAGKPGTTGDTIQRVAAAHPDFTADDHREASDMHQAAIGGAHGAAHADHMLAHDSAAQEKARARAGAPASAKPWGYHNGDKVQFSGTTRDVAGGTFHEFTYLEGHKKGQSGVTQHGPGSAMNPWPRTERPIEPEPAKKKPAPPAGTQLGLFKSVRLVLKAFGVGEGSRGGHIVGHTKGGHPIYAGAGLGGVDGHKPMPSLERHLARSYGKMHPVDHLREAHNHATMADDRARRNDHDAALHQAVLSDWHAGQAHAKSRGAVGGDHKPMLWNEEQIAEHARVKQAAADRDEAERAAASGGPHLVGRTSSGKGVYRTLDRERLTRGGTGAQAQHSWQNLHRHFTPDEHAEAAELHRNLAEQHRGDATLHSYHRMHATAHHEARAEQHERIAKDAKSRAAGGSKVARQVQLFHEKAASHARAEAGSPQFSMFKSVRLVLAAHRNAAGALILKAKAPTPLAPAPSPGAHVLGKTRSGKAVYASGAEVDGFTAQDHRDAAGLHQDAHAYHDARSGEHGDSAGRDPDWRRAESHTADADRHRKLADHHAELTRDHLIAGGHGGTAAIDVRALKPAPSDPEERAEAKQRFRGRKHRDYPGGATAYDRAQYRRRAA